MRAPALHGIARIVIMGLACGFYVYYGVYKMLFAHFDLVGGDFLRGCFAVRNLLEGRSLYEMPAGVNPLYYPPLSVAVFFPLCVFGPAEAKVSWFVLTHAMVLSAAWLTYKSCGEQNRRDAILATLVSFGFSMPLQGLVLTGNLNILILLGLSVALYALISRKAGVFPGIFACFTWIKIYPAGLMLPLVWNRHWKEVGRYTLIAIALGVLSVSVFGLKAHIFFLEQLPSLSRYVGLYLGLISFMHVAKLIVGENHGLLLMVANAIFALALLSLCCARSRGVATSERGAATVVVDVVMVMLVIMLALPSSWGFYHAFLVLPQSLILFLWLQRRCRFKAIPVFLVLMGVISIWEIIAYQVPISTSGLTIRQIGEGREEFLTLYRALYAIPFALTMGVFTWLLLNYDELHRGVRGLVIRQEGQVGT